MQLRSKYSTISLAALALAFSIASAAAQTEVRGNDRQAIHTTASPAAGEARYLAFNQYAGVPSSTVYAPAPPPVDTTGSTSSKPYDSALLDALQRTVTAELEALIELRGF